MQRKFKKSPSCPNSLEEIKKGWCAMAYLLNAKTGIICPKVEGELKNHLRFLSTCEISDDILKIMAVCINETSKLMSEEGMFENPNSIPTVNIIISDSDTISLKLSAEQLAINTHLIFYNLDRLKPHPEHIQCMIIIEELCHIFWNIKSEFDVNFKVYEITKRIYPNLKIFDYYNKVAMIEESRKEGKVIPPEYFE